jgi:hypothetical protein
MIHSQPSSRSIVRSLAHVLGTRRPFAEERPLPQLSDVQIGQAGGGRWLGVRTIPTECIRGTTSSGGARRADFRPAAGHEPADWATRWSRLRTATEDVILPPIQLVRAAGGYWIVDGHNRVALARERGQRWIDAEVTELDVHSSGSSDAAQRA